MYGIEYLMACRDSPTVTKTGFATLAEADGFRTYRTVAATWWFTQKQPDGQYVRIPTN